MDNTSYVALARGTSLQRRLDVIANNIANMDTVGYKKRKVVFSEFLVQAERPFADRNIREHRSVTDLRTVRDVQDGAKKNTGNSFDMALTGGGFFKVGFDDGFAYTRAGNFKLNANRQLITTNGNSVLSQVNQPIVLPDGVDDFQVSSSGVVFADGVEIDQIGLAEFADTQNMEAVGDALFITDQAEEAAVDTKILQGMLEESNVQPVVEMTKMIDTLRMFQANQKMIEAQHERERSSIQKIADPRL